MSYEDGWAAINLEMPRRIPRTEYSAEMHWDLIRAVTGIDVRVDSPDETKDEASVALMRAWNYDFFFMAVGNHIPPNTLVESALYYNQVYEELCWR